MNIYSGSRDGNGLAAALTNPTTLSRRRGTIAQDYSLEYLGRTWPDAETAYVRIIAAKLTQHPRLHEAITSRGGDVAFLRTCCHFTYAKTARFQSWEGFGVASRFIRNLIRAHVATMSQATEKWWIDANVAAVLTAFFRAEPQTDWQRRELVVTALPVPIELLEYGDAICTANVVTRLTPRSATAASTKPTTTITALFRWAALVGIVTLQSVQSYR